MKHKTAELTGALLDAAVAKAEGDTAHMAYILRDRGADNETPPLARPYSSEWHAGGPIIERERIRVQYEHGDGDDAQWYAACRSFEQIGPTPLIAAMRAFVAHKLGNEVEL